MQRIVGPSCVPTSAKMANTNTVRMIACETNSCWLLLSYSTVQYNMRLVAEINPTSAHLGVA